MSGRRRNRFNDGQRVRLTMRWALHPCAKDPHWVDGATATIVGCPPLDAVESYKVALDVCPAEDVFLDDCMLEAIGEADA